MSSKKRSAFSLLEIIAAVIILAVVATATISTVAPMRAKSDAKLDESSLASLNGLAQNYYMERGAWPTRVADLARRGYLDARNNRAHYNRMNQKFEWDATRNQFVAR